MYPWDSKLAVMSDNYKHWHSCTIYNLYEFCPSLNTHIEHTARTKYAPSHIANILEDTQTTQEGLGGYFLELCRILGGR